MKTKTLSTIFLSFCAYSAFAGVWTPAGKITKIESYGTDFRVEGLNLSANPASCGSTQIAIIDGGKTDDQMNRMLSILLAAHHGGKKVQVKLHDTQCSENRPTFYAVSSEDE